MKLKVILALLLACALGVVAVSGAGAKAPKPSKKKKPVAAKPKFDARYDCSKVVTLNLLNGLVGGWGGTYGAKHHSATISSLGGGSICDYTQSGGWPSSPTAEGPGEVMIFYGAAATDFYKRDHAAAVQGVRCDGMKAQGLTPDPRQCGPVAVAGVAGQAYEAASYIAALRGKVFVQVSLHSIPNADQTGNIMPPADLLASVAEGVLARLPAM